MSHHKQTSCPHSSVSLPHERNTPFDPAGALTALSEQAPIHRLRYPDGHLGWLVTGYDAICQILTDARFSARSEFKRAPVARASLDPFYGRAALPGWLVDMDPPHHTRYRRVLSELLSLKRMKALKPRIETIFHEHLDAMALMSRPLDLVEHFSLPVPSLVICELLGVPYAHRREFQHHSAVLFSLEVSATLANASMDYLTTFLLDLVRHKRTQTTDDLLGELTRIQDFSDEEIAGLGVLLLTAGHETTASMLSLGTFALLTQPTQLAHLLNNPANINNAVEVLLRYLTIFQFGVPRTPLEDVSLEDCLMKTGDSVTLSLPAANRCPTQFNKPHQLDISESARGHLAFGFGIHYCIGRNLARIEMQIGYLALFQRFPTLQLSVPPAAVRLNTDAGFYGVHRLPITW